MKLLYFCWQPNLVLCQERSRSRPNLSAINSPGKSGWRGVAAARDLARYVANNIFGVIERTVYHDSPGNQPRPPSVIAVMSDAHTHALGMIHKCTHINESVEINQYARVRLRRRRFARSTTAKCTTRVNCERDEFIYN